jgi:ParB family chromosome partitioning protein
MRRDVTQRLGRGLASLIADTAADGDFASSDVRRVPTGDLEPGSFQPRGIADPERLKELTDSIRTQGILQPLLLRPHPHLSAKFEIIAGERRWRSATELGLDDVPALIRDLSDSEALAAGLVENLQREDLNALEEAAGYARLIEEFHLTQERLAEAVGKSRSHVANMVRLLKLPGPVQAALRAGTITSGHARALLTHPDPERALKAIIVRGLNVRQTEALIPAAIPHGEVDATTQRPEKDADTKALERELADRLGLKVDVRFNGQRGTIRISFSTLEQLDGLIGLLSR